MTATTETTVGVGRVARVTGPVVDVEFPAEAMPEIFNALHTTVTFPSDDPEAEDVTRLLLEVAVDVRDAEAIEVMRDSALRLARWRTPVRPSWCRLET